MSFVTRALDPNNLRTFFDAAGVVGDFARGIAEDVGFVGRARRALFPLPFDRVPALETEPFGAFEPLDAPALQGARLAVVASGGSGATAAALGVLRALEEARLQPVAMSASSGSVLFTLPWACGLSAAEVARFWLGLPQEGYLDPDWTALLRSGRHALGAWAGLLKGEALERSIRELLGSRTLGETRVPFTTVAWNVDLNRIEVVGTHATPELEVATVMRLAISIPIFVEPVQLKGHLYADGGIVDIFPARPVLQDRPDLVLGINSYLPLNFDGEDVTGWRQRSFAIMRASGQLRWSGMVALAREQALLLGDRLVLLHPVPYEEVRGARFYETFIDRSRWAHFMRLGRTAARDLLPVLQPSRPGRPRAA